MKLYFSPHSCALASHIALEEAGADFEAIRVDFASNEQRGEAFLKINPKGRVPALVTERGILTETPAILFYIAQTHPTAQLAPFDDPFALGQALSFASYLCATVHVAHAHRTRGYRWVDDVAAIEAMKKKAAGNVAECFRLIETEMLVGPYVLGERYSVCDPYLFTLATWLEADGVDPTQFPKVLAHRKLMAQRAAVVRALKLHE
ncbi:glutathione S-transferase family protein [Dongia sp.]|uniref:glutathione S-transferase family protein n=1 Tax=Dongia sp. TaxID=1977262 RepID=UPI0035AFC67D